jgi:excisionase family DNA binding protein
MNPDLLMAKEVAVFLRIPLSTVYYLARTRKIPGIQIGRIWRFRKDAILRLTGGNEDSDRPEKKEDRGSP